jgi:GDPmannose 4,6-dehydratase
MEIMSADVAKLNLHRSEKTVMITGVSGQDGSLMADYLLKTTTHNIIGGARRLAVHNHGNFTHLENQSRFSLVNFDLTDTHSIDKLIREIRPHYFINLAAQTFVKSSWDFPVQTWETNTTGVLHILEAIRQHCPKCRFYNAGSSEEFGDVAYSPQDEKHPLRPRSPYGASKAAARQLVKVYRESYNLFAIQSWLFNHEGPRRGKEFVTRKISSQVVDIYKSLKGKFTPIIPLELGNLDAMRDWSDAEDCVKAIWLMLNNAAPVEYVVSSGKSHSIREFVELAFEGVGIKGQWVGKGVEEVYKYVSGPVSPDAIEGTLVKINPSFYRPAEVESLCGDSTRIRKLGWRPLTDFAHLVAKMVHRDMQLAGLGDDFFNLHVKVGGIK